MCYNYGMDLNNYMVRVLELFKKAFSIILSKPYATVKVSCSPQKDNADIEFSIINESFKDIEVNSICFLTNYNRQVPSAYLDSRMPITVPEDGRVTYSIPIEELRASLNKSVGDRITRALVFDQTQHKHIGFVDKAAQEAIAG